MVTTILSILLFSLAAICNAMMDVISFHWYSFRWEDRVNPQWWNPFVSWRNKYIDGDPDKGLKFHFFFRWAANFLDAWHLFKMIQIILITLSIITFPFANQICLFDTFLWNQLAWLCIFGLAWNIPFNLFFHKIFVIKD